MPHPNFIYHVNLDPPYSYSRPFGIQSPGIILLLNTSNALMDNVTIIMMITAVENIHTFPCILFHR